METVENKLDQLVAKLNEAKKDCSKFDRGMNAPGTRIRKVAQEVSKELKVLRFLVTNVRKSRKEDKPAKVKPETNVA